MTREREKRKKREPVICCEANFDRLRFGSLHGTLLGRFESVGRYHACDRNQYWPFARIILADRRKKK